jgi:hypothetical protein
MIPSNPLQSPSSIFLQKNVVTPSSKQQHKLFWGEKAEKSFQATTLSKWLKGK